VTSEKRLALSHSGFWNALLPMEEPYIRAHNARVRKFAHEMFSLAPADQRGVVNECAFLLFATALTAEVDPNILSKGEVAKCAAEAFNRIGQMHFQFSRASQNPLTQTDVHEATLLAARLSAYFASRTEVLLSARPFFPGCGWVDDAEGDVLGDRTLFEIKAGERRFRGSDAAAMLLRT
jgi:hypothetical protein